MKRHMLTDVEVEEVSLCPVGMHKGARVVLLKQNREAIVEKKSDLLGEVEALASEIRKANPKLSKAQAVDRALQIEPQLYERYRAAQFGLPAPPEPTLVEKLGTPRGALLFSIESAASELRKSDLKLSQDQAVARVLEREPKLYAAYRSAAG